MKNILYLINVVGIFTLITLNSCNLMTTKKSKAISKEEEVQQNPDPHIDQDFPGFPHSPSGKKNITPETNKEKKIAGTNKTRSKKTYGGDKKE